jgi:8-oxo-dGTP diphosphatase
MERFKLIAAMYLILIHDNKILLMRRKNTGYEDGNYGVPSGHLEDGESLKYGMVREAKEEIDIDIDMNDIELVHIMHRREHDIRIDFFFKVKKYTGTPRNAEPDKCDDLQWFPLDDLPANTIPYIKEAIEKSLAKHMYSEIGW